MAQKLNLSESNFKWAAQQLGCEPEMVIGVSFVECKRKPFDADGFPAILYERHVFYRNAVKHHGRQVANEWMRIHPQLCNVSPTPKGGYGSYSAQRGKFNRAWKLCPDCAMEACSWGPFQELGENWEGLGFKSVGEFVDVMKSGVEGALFIFVKSIKWRGLADDMQLRRYATIAELYNGRGYRKFNYHTQIENAYKKAKALKINWANVTASIKLPDLKKKALTPSVTVDSDPIPVEVDTLMSEVQETEGIVLEEDVADTLEESGEIPWMEGERPPENQETVEPQQPPIQQDVVINGPPPSNTGSKMTGWLAGLGITLPTLGGAFEALRNWYADGTLDAAATFETAKIVFLAILPYMIYLVIIFAVFWCIKELMKYATTFLQTWMAGKQDYNNVTIRPMYNPPSKPLSAYFWKTAPVEPPEKEYQSIFDELENENVR